MFNDGLYFVINVCLLKVDGINNGSVQKLTIPIVKLWLEEGYFLLWKLSVVNESDFYLSG